MLLVTPRTCTQPKKNTFWDNRPQLLSNEAVTEAWTISLVRALIRVITVQKVTKKSQEAEEESVFPELETQTELWMESTGESSTTSTFHSSLFTEQAVTSELLLTEFEAVAHVYYNIRCLLNPQRATNGRGFCYRVCVPSEARSRLIKKLSNENVLWFSSGFRLLLLLPTLRLLQKSQQHNFGIR